MSIPCLSPSSSSSSSPSLSSSSPSSCSSSSPLSLLSLFRQSWLSADSIIYRDVPRLARRVGIETEERGKILEKGRLVTQRGEEDNEREAERSISPSPTSPSPSASPSSPSDSSSPIDPLEVMINLIQSLVQSLESADTIEKVHVLSNEYTASLSSSSSPSSSSTNASNLSVDTYLRSAVSFLPPSSRTRSILNVLHQSILVPAMSVIRGERFQRVGMLKDQRGENGWTILISLLKGNISITHRRGEESIQSLSDGTSEFSIQWELRLSFDEHMQDLRAGIIRIKQIVFNPLIDPQRRQFVNETFQGGELIL